MDEITYAYGTAAVIIGYFLAQVASRRFDPFAPTWLFLVGYLQIYVVQAITYHAWAVSVRGKDLVASADWRALWAVVWFLIVYHVGPGRRRFAGAAPTATAMVARPGRVHGPSADPVGPLLLRDRATERVGGSRVGRGLAVPLVPVRADGGGDPPDRDGP